MLHLLVPHQASALDLLKGLQCSVDPLQISSCLQCKKRSLAFYKLNLEHKSSGMTKCLEKPLYLCFLVSALAKKKNTKAIKFLGILKRYVSMNKKTDFCFKNKNLSLNKKFIFVFHMIFKLDFITQTIYCFIHRCLYSLFILLLSSFISF